VASVGSVTTRALVDLLTAESGVTSRVVERLRASNQPVAELVEPRVVEGYVAAELFDRSQGGKYPQIVVYCERVRNTMTEKFNRFSGTVEMVVEVRHSQDRIEGLEQRTQMFSEAVAEVLENARGAWGEGIYYTGEYEIKFEQVKHGGRNFLQVARVKAPVEVKFN
jgi:hypothetical protein